MLHKMGWQSFNYTDVNILTQFSSMQKGETWKQRLNQPRLHYDLESQL
jgi:hypothetical protein